MNARERFDACRDKGDFADLCADLMAELATRESTSTGTTFAHDALAARVAELEAALIATEAALNDPGVGDIEQWKRDCKRATFMARAALKAAGAQS